MSPSHQEAARRRTLRRLIAIVIAVVVVFFLIETMTRLFDLTPRSDVVYADSYRFSDNPVLQYELVPGSRGSGVRVSDAGLRDREYPLQKAAGTFRIMIIGDSIAYGFGVAQDEMLSAQFADLFARYWPHEETKFEILNLGVSGYNIEQIVENLRVRGLPFDPDLIIYTFCLNDAMTYSFELEALKSLLTEAQYRLRNEMSRDRQPSALEPRSLALAKYAVYVWQDSGERPGDLDDPQRAAFERGVYDSLFTNAYDDSAMMRRLSSGLDELARIARERGVPVVSLIFPLFVDLDAYRLAPLHRRVIELHASAGVPAYDLLTLYVEMRREHGPVFLENALVPNAMGHRLAALYGLLVLAQDGLLPLSKPRQGQVSHDDYVIGNVVARALTLADSIRAR